MSSRNPRNAAPRLLDLFCGAGGCSVGYARAGFEVIGVDIKPQPHYPFEFIQADALTYPLEGFDAIHASPPCQAYSDTKSLANARQHPDLLPPVRTLLEAVGAPWVIENVPGAPMRPDLILCGTMFGLGVRRHRWFETNWSLPPFVPATCRCRIGETIEVTGTGGPSPRHRKPTSMAQAHTAMGIDWMVRTELVQAIPPAYTEWIGHQLLDHLEMAA